MYRGSWYWEGRLSVTRDNLVAYAWSAPMRELAADLGMYDTGLKKLLKTQAIFPPPQGYWNKVKAGKVVPVRPLAPPRGPGQSDRVGLDSRFVGKIEAAPPIAPKGPFRSRLVPEDLEALRAQELKALGRVMVPRDLLRPASGLFYLLRREDKPLAMRRLRILNGVFLALAKRGHRGEAYERDGDLYANAIIGDCQVSLKIEISGKHNTVTRYARQVPDPDLPASTTLQFRLDVAVRHEMPLQWIDTAEVRLESKLAEIVAAIIVAREARYRA